MSFFKVNIQEASKPEGGSNHITHSGIYAVTLKNVIVQTNNYGARSLDLYVDNNGTPQVLYSAIKLENNDGKANYQANLFNKLCVVCGIEEVSEPEEATLPIGPKQAPKDVAVLPDFTDIDIKIRIQMEYSVIPEGYPKSGQISEKKVLKAVFRADGASSSEIINESEIGVQLAKDEKYADNITYKDGLTAEAIDAWISSGRAVDKTSTPSPTAPKPTFGKPSFGKK